MPTGLKAVGLEGFQKWFKTDKVIIDNWLFRLHHQVNFAVLMVGLIFIFVENHLNGKSITCKGDDAYSNKFCWIHGTGHVAQALQGKVTHCIVDQTVYTDQEGDTKQATITYYLWLPFLLVLLLGLSKLSRTVWKNLEGGLIESLIKNRDAEKIGTAFLEKNNKKNDIKYRAYHMQFFICEFLNMAAVITSMWICDLLFLGKFWSYGSEVFDFIKLDSKVIEEYKIPDPKCNLFPTEVSCDVSFGAITGNTDDKNFLCILSNNIFNQHYFFALWIWWVMLLVISGICLVFRLAQIVIPGLSKRMFQLRHRNISIVHRIDGLPGAYFFVLNRISDNLDLLELEKLLKYVQECKEGSSLVGAEKGKASNMDNLYADEI